MIIDPRYPHLYSKKSFTLTSDGPVNVFVEIKDYGDGLVFLHAHFKEVEQ